MNNIIDYMFFIGVISLIIAIISGALDLKIMYEKFIILAGILILTSISLLTIKKDTKKEFKPQYKIDLMSKDSVKIDNGEIIKTIHLNNIENYIKNDTINN